MEFESETSENGKNYAFGKIEHKKAPTNRRMEAKNLGFTKSENLGFAEVQSNQLEGLYQRIIHLTPAGDGDNEL